MRLPLPANAQPHLTQAVATRLLLWIGITVLALGTACGESTAIDLHLFPDPNVTDPEALITQLSAIKILLDTPDDASEGLYPASRSRQEGELFIEDVDHDGWAELWGVFEVGGLSGLPRIRIEQGGLPGSILDIELDGLSRPNSAALAAGGVAGVAFFEGEIREVNIPFDLRREFRPPIVSQVIPEDRAQLLGNNALKSVWVAFSKQMNWDSLNQVGTFSVIHVREDQVEEWIPAKTILIKDPVSGQEHFTVAEYQLAGEEKLAEGLYRVSIGAAALDYSGRALDQRPLEKGNQAFSSTFTLQEIEVTTTVPTCPPDCPSPLCSEGGTRCLAGFVCNTTLGECLPQQCPTTCPDGFVCNEGIKLCVVDCRLNGSYGGCPKALHCQDTGLCAP